MVLLAVRNTIQQAGRVGRRQWSSLPPPVLQTTKLPNNIRLVSVTQETPTTHIGLYVSGGPRNESYPVSGISHFLRRAAFKATEARTPVTYCRQLESLTEDYQVTTARDHIAFTADINDGDAASLMTLLADAANPRLLYEYEGEEIRALVKEDIDSLTTGDVIEDFIHQAAFRNGPLSQSPHCPNWNVDNINIPTLKDFAKSQYTGHNMVIVSVGPVEHGRLVSIARNTFDDIVSGDDDAPDACVYNGGEVLHTASGPTSLVLALNGPTRTSPDLPAAQVAAAALGYHTFLYNNGFGSGKHGLLYKNVFAPHKGMLAVNPYLTSYADGGLFGVQAVYTEGEDVAEALANQLAALSTPMTAEQLDRAKNIAKGHLTEMTDRNSSFASILGNNVLAGATPQLGSEMAAAIDQVTSDAVVAAVKKMKASPLSVACVGDLTCLPTYAQLSKIVGTPSN